MARHVGAGGPSLAPDQFAAVMPEVGVEESDFVVTRYGGMGGLSGIGGAVVKQIVNRASGETARAASRAA